MQTAAYAIRELDFVFRLGTGSFGASGGNQKTYKNLRGYIHVDFAAYPTTGPAQIRIFGMPLSDMNALSKAGLVYQARDNFVAVQAGDAKSGKTTVFSGTIVQAYPDFRDQPNGSFFVVATPSNVIQLKPVPAASYKDGTSVQTILTFLCAQAGLTLENNGVTTALDSQYLSGTVWSQIGTVLRAANIFGYLDGVAGVLAIWPKTGSRSTPNPPVISAATGMIGYPSFQFINTTIRKLFDPNLKPGVGQKIKVESEIQAANGEFTVVSVTHDLASQTPDGPWETTIEATPVTVG